MVLVKYMTLENRGSVLKMLSRGTDTPTHRSGVVSDATLDN